MAILDLGMVQIGDDGSPVGISSYVIQTTADETVLIDSGCAPKYVQDPQTPSEDGAGLSATGLALTEEQLLPAQLTLLGLGMGDVDLLIQSHTHITRIGYMDAFGNVPIVIAKAERDLSSPIGGLDSPAMEWPKADYILLEDDTLIGPAFEALVVPGHTPGQLAFSVVLPDEGAIVLTCDAIGQPDQLDIGFAGAWDADLAQHHAMRLMQRALRDRGSLIYGHSPDQWRKLRKAPEWYT